MNILEFKRKALGYTYRWSDRGTDSTGTGSGNTGGSDSGGMGTNNGGGGDGFSMFGVSYANPSDDDMTTKPETNLTPEQKAAAREVVNGVLRGEITQDQVSAALAEKGLSPSIGSKIGSMIGSLFGALFGPIGKMFGGAIGKKAGEALATDDPFSGLMSLAKDVRSGTYGEEAKTAFGSYQGDYKSGNGDVSSDFTKNEGEGTAPGASTDTTEGLKDPITLATSIANQAWNDWQGDKKTLQGLVATNTDRGNQLYDTSMQTVAGNLDLSKQMQGDYNNIYRPAGQKYANYVNMLGTEKYRDSQASSAMADVQQQATVQQQANQRNMNRMGVNPASGRAMALNNQNGLRTAALQAGAGTQARRNAYTDWSNGLIKMTDMGNNTLSAAKGLDSSAQQWSTLGMNAGNTGFLQNSDLSKLGAGNAASAGNVAGTAANALFGQAASNRADDAANPWTTLAGAGLTSAIKGIDWGNLWPSSGFTSTPGMPSSTDEDPLEFLSGLGG